MILNTIFLCKNSTSETLAPAEAWYNMEKAISDMLTSNNPPSVKLEMEFNFTGSSKRPDSIDVDVYVKASGSNNYNLDRNLSKKYDNPK